MAEAAWSAAALRFSVHNSVDKTQLLNKTQSTAFALLVCFCMFVQCLPSAQHGHSNIGVGISFKAAHACFCAG